ncbi:MAG TPA: hypothetical protein DCS21_00360, partial [Gammaproteobacteria bacterium]|nr:hypothetical protein [Gammaproteobacteria bacterium]
MPTRILLQLLLLAGLAAPLGAFALGVGQLTVRSALNQNFEAEIPLIVNNPAELVGLTTDSIRIPLQQVFADMGVERLEFFSKLRFAVQTTPGGPSFIRVTSVQPIREPSFDLLLEVVWPRGRLLRTFPVHLDPELYADRQAPPPPPVEPLPVQAPLVEAPTEASPVAEAPGAPSEPPVSFENASLYGPVRRGENLTRIAEKVRPSPAVSVPDMMAILVAGNPQAFSNGNPNTLRVGATLRVPSPQALGMTGEPAPPAPVPDIAAVTPVEPQTSPLLSPVEAPMLTAPPVTETPPVVETPPVAEIPPVVETPPVVQQIPPTSLEPPQEIIPQVTLPLEPPPPVV